VALQVRLRNLDGTFELSHMDEVVDKMLHSDLLFDIALPRIPHRSRQHSTWMSPNGKGCVCVHVHI
jgi:PRP38 family